MKSRLRRLTGKPERCTSTTASSPLADSCRGQDGTAREGPSRARPRSVVAARGAVSVCRCSLLQPPLCAHRIRGSAGARALRPRLRGAVAAVEAARLLLCVGLNAADIARRRQLERRRQRAERRLERRDHGRRTLPGRPSSKEAARGPFGLVGGAGGFGRRVRRDHVAQRAQQLAARLRHQEAQLRRHRQPVLVKPPRCRV
eukprot:7385074-Prymnesium_polylepis.2